MVVTSLMDIIKKRNYYSAFIERNKEYDGIFYVGVKTTGVFCHTSCPAKKPKFENCEFFSSAKEALLASYRPCKRCKPLLPPGQQSESIKKLIEAIEENPEKRWKDQDFKALGPMISIVEKIYLYLLEFVDRRGLEKEIERLRRRLKVGIVPGQTEITEQIKAELSDYFSGTSYIFHTPCYFLESAFEKSVWNALKLIPPGQTCSYITVARKIGRPNAFRAVANANGKNQLAIIVPCHRVINENGELGDYGGGLNRKQWLITHEKKPLMVKP